MLNAESPLSACADLSPLSASVGAKRLPPASSAPFRQGGAKQKPPVRRLKRNKLSESVIDSALF